MYLDDRSVRILEELFEYESLTVDEIAKNLSLSKRSVYYSIEDIDSWLIRANLKPLESIRGKGYFLENKAAVEGVLKKVRVFPDFTVVERHSLIVCALLMCNRKIQIEDLMELTLVSRNTVFSDFKIIRESFSRYSLELTYDQNLGYVVEGSEMQKRSLFLFKFRSLHDLVLDAKVPEHLKYNFLNRSQISYAYAKLQKIEAALGVEYVEGTLVSISTLINVVLHGREKLEDLSLIEEDIESHPEYKYLQKEFTILDKSELEYFALHLLSTRTQIATTKNNGKENYELAQEMIRKFEKLAAITFSNRTLLTKQISNHLSLSYYRYRYGIHHANPLLEQIKEKYYDEFVITDQVCDIIRNKYKVPVGDGEVAYISLYFASFLVRKNFSKDHFTLHIVCPSGVSTSMMLKSELEYLHNKIRIDKVMSIKEFNSCSSELSEDDLIISTVALDTNLKYLKVNPVMTSGDKTRILETLPFNSGSILSPKTSDIIDIVKPYVSNEDLKLIEKDLNKYFVITLNHEKTKDIKIIDVLTPNKVCVVNNANSWQQALHLAAKPLLEESIIKKGYVEAIITATDRFGPYMVIEGGYMIAHASYDDGVNELGLSFLKLENPVSIKDEFIDKIFMLAPIDQRKHLGMIRELSNVFTDVSFSDTLNNLNDSKDIYLALVRFLMEQ